MTMRRFDVNVEFSVPGEDADEAERTLVAILDGLGFDYSVTYVRVQP